MIHSWERLVKISLLRLLPLFLLGSCLFADDLTWGGTYVGVWSGYGTSPYTAIDNTTHQTIVIFCLDYNDEIAPPMQWKANIRDLTQDNVTNYAQFGGNYGLGITTTPWAFNGDGGATAGHAVDLSASSSAYSRYLEAAWLFNNILQAQLVGDMQTMIVSQVAAWDLLVESQNATDLRNRIAATNSPSNKYTFKNYQYETTSYSTAPTVQSLGALLFQDAVDEALKGAQNAVLNQSWYGSAYSQTWDIVTADPTWTASYGRPVQEFLTVATTPEPWSIVLLASLVALVVVRVRRHAARQV